MKTKEVPGIKGYSDVTEKFTQATLGLDFEKLHQDFLPFIPTQTSHILDIGAGIGRDAAELYKRGHRVKAVEPTDEYRAVGQQLYAFTNIEWIDDSLPDLELLGSEQFDFILVSGVWHHLDEAAQYHALQRTARLLSLNGHLALTLRNGPEGAGIHIFPTNGKLTIEQAKQCGLTTVMYLENQPSLMPNKKAVSWAKLVFKKQVNN